MNSKKVRAEESLHVISLHTWNKFLTAYPGFPGALWICSLFHLMLGYSSFLLGDNLQTAVTVARNSGMVSEGQKVILVEANEDPGSSSASISWKLVEEKKHIPYRNQVHLKTDFLPYYLILSSHCTALLADQLWLAEVCRWLKLSILLQKPNTYAVQRTELHPFPIPFQLSCKVQCFPGCWKLSILLN